MNRVFDGEAVALCYTATYRVLKVADEVCTLSGKDNTMKVCSPEFDFTHSSEGNGYSVCGVRGGQGPKEIVNRNRERLFLRLYFGDTGPASQWWGRNRWAQCLLAPRRMSLSS